MENNNKKKGYHIDEFMNDWGTEFETKEEELGFKSAELLIRESTSYIQILKDYCDGDINRLSSESIAKFILGQIFMNLDVCEDGFIERINNVCSGKNIQGEERGPNRLNENFSKLTNIDDYFNESLYNDEILTPNQEERIGNVALGLRKIIEKGTKNYLRDVDATVSRGVQTYSERVIDITIHNLIYNRKEVFARMGTIVNIPHFG